MADASASRLLMLKRAGRRIDQGGDPSQSSGTLIGPEMKHQNRGHAEIDEIAKRVEFGPHGAFASQPTRQASVQAVKHRRKNDQGRCPVEFFHAGKADCRQTCAKRRKRQDIRQQLHHGQSRAAIRMLGHRQSIRAGRADPTRPSSAMTVSPATIV